MVSMTDTPKRIAVVSSTFPPYRGGMGNVAADHAEALSREGHDVEVFIPKIPGDEKHLDPHVHQVWSPFRYGNAAVLPQLVWKLRGFDIVELHYPFFGGAEYVLLWKKLFGKNSRLVVFYHMDVVGKGVHKSIFKLYRKLFLNRIMFAADRIIASSRDYLEHSLIKHFALDARVRAVPFSVDTKRFTPASERNKNTVLFVGGLDSAHYFKGIEILLEAFHRVSKKIPEARLLIVGDGDLREGYEKKMSDIGIADKVRFSGRLTDNELPDAFRDSAMVILPSLDQSEAFGLVLLEGAASGLPAIAANLPGVRAVIREGETGLLVPPGRIEPLEHAISDLFHNPSKADMMGVKARNMTEDTYAIDVVHASLIEAITK